MILILFGKRLTNTHCIRKTNCILFLHAIKCSLFHISINLWDTLAIWIHVRRYACKSKSNQNKKCQKNYVHGFGVCFEKTSFNEKTLMNVNSDLTLNSHNKFYTNRW